MNTKNNPKKTGVVCLKNLPDDLIYLQLRKEFKKKLIEETKNRKILIKSFKEGHAISLMKIKHVIKHLDSEKFSIKKMTENIIELKTISSKKGIINPILPFNFNSEEGGNVVAGFIFDGGVNTKGRPTYGDNCLDIRISFVESCKEVFGNLHINNKELMEGRNQINFPKVMGLILNELGIENGSKLNKNKEIPEFILKGNRETIKGFLQRGFEDEGSPVFNKKKGDRIIVFEQNMDISKINENIIKLVKNRKILPIYPKTIIQINKLLRSMKINSTIYFSKEKKHSKSTSHTIRLKINDKESLERFREKINFLSKRKKEKLQEIIKSYKQIQYQNGKSEEAILKICQKVYAEKGEFSSQDIMEVSKRSRSQVNNILRKLCKSQKIKKIKSLVPKYGTHPFNIYKIEI